MAVSKRGGGASTGGRKFYNNFKVTFKKGSRELYNLIMEPSRCYIVAFALILAETCVNWLIINKVGC